MKKGKQEKSGIGGVKTWKGERKSENREVGERNRKREGKKMVKDPKNYSLFSKASRI